MSIISLDRLAKKIKGRINGTQIRAQRVMIITQDGRIVDTMLDVESGYYVDHKTRMAFLASRNNLLPIKDEESYCAFYFEGDAAPINLGARNKALREQFASNIKVIQREARANAMHAVNGDLSKDKMVETIKQILLIFAILTALVIFLSIVIYWFT